MAQKKCPEGFRFDDKLKVCVPKGQGRYYGAYGFGIAKNQNTKVLVSIDNAIQSPIAGTAVTTTLAKDLLVTEDVARFSGITSIFGADYVQIDDEIMKYTAISTNAVSSVSRGQNSTTAAAHADGAADARRRLADMTWSCFNHIDDEVRR